MRNLRRNSSLAVSAAALCFGVLGPIASASAEDLSPELSAHAWYWSTNKRFTVAIKDPVLGASQKFDVASGGPVGLVPGGGISPISIGHLGISMINGSSDMRSYARWNLNDVPEGSTVQSFVVAFTLSKFSQEHLQFHLDSESRPPSTIGEDFAKVDACPVTETLTSSEAEPSSSFSFQRPEVENNQSTDINRTDQRLEPLYDCGRGRIRGALTSDRSKLTFDLTSMAQQWVDDPLSNNGIAMIGTAEGLTTTWMLELHGLEMKAQVDVGLPVSAPVPLPETDPPPPNQYVAAADAPTASISFEAPVEEAPICGAVGGCDGDNGGGGGTTIINQPGTNTTTVVQQPGITTTETIYTVAPTGTLPVGDIATPGWMLLAFPLGLLALGAMFSAVGKDELETATVPLAGSRVASLLRQRRLES